MTRLMTANKSSNPPQRYDQRKEKRRQERGGRHERLARVANPPRWFFGIISRRSLDLRHENQAHLEAAQAQGELREKPQTEQDNESPAGGAACERADVPLA